MESVRAGLIELKGVKQAVTKRWPETNRPDTGGRGGEEEPVDAETRQTRQQRRLQNAAATQSAANH